MAENSKDEREQLETLSTRIERYRVEVQRLVSSGAEHPQYEFKRCISLARESLADRLDFIKLVQGLANSEIAEERFVIIGADQREKRFHAVDDVAQFDSAKISQLFSKYLDPLPTFEIFNALQTDDGVQFVLLVLGAVQPRPIVVKTEGQVSEISKAHIRPGEVWVKSNTGLRLATRGDLDAMYSHRIEEEAESRARKRFRHLREEFDTEMQWAVTPRKAVRSDLIFGPRQEFKRFVEELIAEQDTTCYKMLLETGRELLLEDWNRIDAFGHGTAPDPQAYAVDSVEHFRDHFLPGSKAMVEAGLLILKYDSSLEWIRSLADLLCEVFEESRHLNRLKDPQSPIPFWRPALEAYIGLRCLACYAVRRSRYRFLPAILCRYTKRFRAGDSSETQVPLLFWPFSQDLGLLPALTDGLSLFIWTQRIETSWADYFGSQTAFLSAACQLEFLLEFNSYAALGMAEKKGQDWIDQQRPGTSFHYIPDLWRYRLEIIEPSAEHLYDSLKGDDELLAHIEIEPGLMKSVFEGKHVAQRLLVLGTFLAHLKKFQETAMWQQQRFPFMFEWQGRLGELVKQSPAPPAEV